MFLVLVVNPVVRNTRMAAGTRLGIKEEGEGLTGSYPQETIFLFLMGKGSRVPSLVPG